MKKCKRTIEIGKLFLNELKKIEDEYLKMSECGSTAYIKHINNPNDERLLEIYQNSHARWVGERIMKKMEEKGIIEKEVDKKDNKKILNVKIPMESKDRIAIDVDILELFMCEIERRVGDKYVVFASPFEIQSVDDIIELSVDALSIDEFLKKIKKDEAKQ